MSVELEYDPGVEASDDESTPFDKMIEETKEFFESLNIAAENIQILKDQPKDQIAAYFEGLVQVSEAFEQVDKNVEKNVLAVIVRWIGFEVSANPTTQPCQAREGEKKDKK